MNKDAMRKEFEAQFSSWPLKRQTGIGNPGEFLDGYVNPYVDGAWDGYRAALSQPQPTTPGEDKLVNIIGTPYVAPHRARKGE